MVPPQHLRFAVHGTAVAVPRISIPVVIAILASAINAGEITVLFTALAPTSPFVPPPNTQPNGSGSQGEGDFTSIPSLPFNDCLWHDFEVGEMPPSGARIAPAPLAVSSPLLSLSSSSVFPFPSQVTPLIFDAWARELAGHPNRGWSQSVLSSISEGTRIGFNPAASSLRSANRNMPSAVAHPDIIDRYLLDECSAGRVAGPFSHPPIPGLHISRFGVIPKRAPLRGSGV